MLKQHFCSLNFVCQELDQLHFYLYIFSAFVPSFQQQCKFRFGLYFRFRFVNGIVFSFPFLRVFSFRFRFRIIVFKIVFAFVFFSFLGETYCHRRCPSVRHGHD